ncbi:MAG: glycoside hydrolase family 9 protein [Firmicutes bacterium]|nr:glycoside hydrolase family 9 protein [Bacillota bacterium]
MGRFLVNRVGYAAGQPKFVYSLDPLQGARVMSEDATVLLTAGEKNVEMRYEQEMHTAIYRWDVSELRREERYRVSRGDEDDTLRVARDPFREVFRLAMRSYYLQRCGQAIDDRESGVQHAACHLALATTVEEGETRDVSGGWHDAGDYGRYMPTAGVTVGQLLLLLVLVPELVQYCDLGTREAEKSGISDVLAEVRYELDWMLRMQRSDGGVYHKVSTERFPGMIMPEADDGRLWVYSVATPDTAVFAAAMARASRVFQAVDARFASQCLAAADAAWKFLKSHEPMLHPKNGFTGSYLTKSDADERLWAAAELFLSTREQEFQEYLRQQWDAMFSGQAVLVPINWEDVSTMAVLALALEDGVDVALQEKAKQSLIVSAEHLVSRINRHPFGCALLPGEYRWASAKTALAYGVNLAAAHYLTKRPEFLLGAVRQWDYVLGCNPLGRSWVTGTGPDSPQHPHHRYVVASGIMIPGLLVGGPNAQAHQQDGIVPETVGPLAYVDDERAYAVNEPAIDYNAPLVVLAGYLHGVLGQGRENGGNVND